MPKYLHRSSMWGIPGVKLKDLASFSEMLEILFLFGIVDLLSRSFGELGQALLYSVDMCYHCLFFQKRRLSTKNVRDLGASV